jgi:hypothetical protein
MIRTTWPPAGYAREILGLAGALEISLPGTKAAFRAGRLTPGSLRAAIKRAVMQVSPEKARQRREHAARQARVERWAEASGNAGLAGRELRPAQALAADQRVTAWARELRKAGLEGDMDQLRARALMDILLGVDSRPRAFGADEPQEPVPDRPVADGPVPDGPVIPPGFAGRINMTIPVTTVLDLADRPGELASLGPVDPNPEANTPNRYRAVS